MKISVVIPFFNEQEVLPQLFERLTAAAKAWGMDYEVVCVDDGSRDGPWALLEEQHRRDERWRGVSFARNFGHQTAVSAELWYARDDAVAIIDADLQDPPEELRRFVEKWREGYDVVYAIRQQRKESVVKRICYWSFYRMVSRMVQFDLPLDSGDFCLMDRKLVDVLKRMPERNRFVRGLRAWAGFRQIGLPYERHARAASAAKYTYRRLIKLAFDGIFNFSTVPLAVVSQLGFWIFCLSLIGILWILATKIFSDFFTKHNFPPVQGFTAIVVSILFLGGIQLLCLGIIGEYIGRIYEEVKLRPPWVIAASVGIDAQTPDK